MIILLTLTCMFTSLYLLFVLVLIILLVYYLHHIWACYSCFYSFWSSYSHLACVWTWMIYLHSVWLLVAWLLLSHVITCCLSCGLHIYPLTSNPLVSIIHFSFGSYICKCEALCVIVSLTELVVRSRVKRRAIDVWEHFGGGWHTDADWSPIFEDLYIPELGFMDNCVIGVFLFLLYLHRIFRCTHTTHYAL